MTSRSCSFVPQLVSPLDLEMNHSSADYVTAPPSPGAEWLSRAEHFAQQENEYVVLLRRQIHQLRPKVCNV